MVPHRAVWITVHLSQFAPFSAQLMDDRQSRHIKVSNAHVGEIGVYLQKPPPHIEMRCNQLRERAHANENEICDAGKNDPPSSAQ